MNSYFSVKNLSGKDKALLDFLFIVHSTKSFKEALKNIRSTLYNLQGILSRRGTYNRRTRPPLQCPAVSSRVETDIY